MCAERTAACSSGAEGGGTHEGEICVVKRPVSGCVAQIGRAITPEPPSQMRSIGAAARDEARGGVWVRAQEGGASL